MVKTLFDPIKINNLHLRNRLVRSATWERMADGDGHLTEGLFELYQDLAEGGIGLIITSAVRIGVDDTSVPGMLGIYDDSFIPEYQKLTEFVHQKGSSILLQAGFAGKDGKFWMPPDPARDQLQSLVKAFGDSAHRAELGGFDGIQIHAAHGFFLSRFLNGRENTREDSYGGDISNRIRILGEIIRSIRGATGQDFNIFIKINCIDFWGDAATFDTCKKVCVQLADWGIQGIEISGGTGQNIDRSEPPYNESFFRDYAAEIAEMVDVPILLVGSNRTPAVMTEILNETRIACFSLARPLISQPNLANIWQQDNKVKAECISCNQCFSTNGIACILQRKKAKAGNDISSGLR